MRAGSPTETQEIPRMQPITWITMAVILTFVWGGFAFLLVKALRKEAGKPSE